MEVNNMLNQIISFVERDVDGCGTDVEVMALLKTDTLLTNGHRKKLENVIEEIRNEWEDDEWDTDSIVEEALARVFGTDVEWKAVIPDIEVEF
jgi:hypothetical protein